MCINFQLATAIVFTLILNSCATGTAHSVPSSPSNSNGPVSSTIDGVDLYGSKRVTLEMIRQSHGKLLQKSLDDSMRGDDAAFALDSRDFSDAIKTNYGLAFAKLTVIKYFNLHNSPGRQVYATIDLVENEDLQRRMTFSPRPHGHFPDPDGLLKTWDVYQKIGFELLQNGEITGMDAKCPAFHCIFGHDHPRLVPFKEVFVSGAKKHANELTTIFLNDESDQARASAAFVMAYIQDGNELIKTLSKRANDESELVRNNVIRVFSEIARLHPDLLLPIEKIVPMLDYPETTDRNKASAVIFGVVSNKVQLQKYRTLVMEKAIPILLETLRLQQPNNHDFAYLILRAVSGKEYNERDYAAWDTWYRDQD